MFPQNIQVQTVSYCNGGCVFCPYESIAKEKLSMGYMKTSLIKKIIDEITMQKHPIAFYPFLMNEPLMDKRLIKIIEYFRQKSDDAIEINTNAILLTTKIGRELLKFNNITLKFNLESKGRHTAIKNVVKFLKMPRKDSVNVLVFTFPGFTKNIKEETKFWKRQGALVFSSILTDRASNLNLNDPYPRFSSGNSCWAKRQNEWMHVLFNGDAVLCCQDWRRECVLGNVKNSSLHSIFNGEKYEAVRDWIARRIEPPPKFICFRCNFFVKSSINKWLSIHKWRCRIIVVKERLHPQSWEPKAVIKG